MDMRFERWQRLEKENKGACSECDAEVPENDVNCAVCGAEGSIYRADEINMVREMLVARFMER